MKNLASILAFVGTFWAAQALAQDQPKPVSLAAFAARTQVGIGFQREWLVNFGEEKAPKNSWVAVVPASYNLTPSCDIVGQAAYNLTSKSTRWVLGVRFVVIGRK